MKHTTLEVKHVVKQFNKDTVLNGLSFQLAQGEILSIVGPSGSGKTTLLRILAGLEKPTAGTISMNGREITNQKANRRDISLVFQQPLLFPHMTVEENIVYGAKVSKKYKKEKTDKQIAAIGMDHYRSHFPSQISGGQQQRTALARAMATEPEIILFDEPFSSLDPNLRQELRYWVRDFLVKQGTTAIFVTHDLEEAMIMGDQIALFQEGDFQQIGKARAIHESPANRKVASFIGGHLILDENQFVPLMEISLNPTGSVNDTISYDGKIEHITYQHGRAIAHIHIKELNQKISIPVAEKSPLPSEVTLTIPESSVRTFQGKHS
ncbi:heme ABC exporter ATP-binding protein CcmA [Halobacillus sp. H74]|uniref:heme ABC exporter ATP-binding protein CcmA n=1 Tax=Halobacillus sp. H74 TaxID=3457436 RepID=UPI003FCDE4A3